MPMPSLLTWIIGAGVLIVLSMVLRYLANDAHELARSRGQAFFAANQRAQALRRTQLAKSDGSRADRRDSGLPGIGIEAMYPLAEQETSASDNAFDCVAKSSAAQPSTGPAGRAV